MNLVIDIGNSSAKLGLFDNNILINNTIIHIIDADSLQKFVNLTKPERVIISDVGNKNNEFKKNIFELFPNTIQLDRDTPLPFRNDYSTLSSLGYDRIAAVAGALAQYPGKDVLVVDAGTAITYDIITRDAVYPGGNISPGLNLRFKALNSFTGKLPLISFEENFPIIGTNTKEAILAGVIQGITNEIDGFIEAFKQKYPELITVFTGGDAPRFVNRLKNPIFASPFLVLNGLNLILNYYFEQQSHANYGFPSVHG